MNPHTQEMLDAAARMRDAINLHVLANALGVRERVIGYVAINLVDGRSDGEFYESRESAVRHTQNKSTGWFYAKVGANTMAEKEAVITFQLARQAHKAGVVFAREDVITPMLAELAIPYIPKTIHTLGIFPTQRGH